MPIEGEDVVLEIPRVVLQVPAFALRLATLPLRGVLYVLGRYNVFERVVDLLYNDERTAAIIPSFSFLGDQGPTVGFTAFHGGWGKHNERLTLSANFGGQYVQSYGLKLDAPNVGGTFLNLSVATRYDVQPHQNFYGFGHGDLQDPTYEPGGPREIHTQSTFEQRRALIRGRAGLWLGEEVNLGVMGIFTSRSFGPDPGDALTDPSIEQVYDTSKLTGFDRGYAIAESLLDLRVDARIPKGATSSGIYLHAFGGGVPPQNGLGYVHYGAEVTGYVDLFKGDRVLALRLIHESVWGREDEIPFTELPRLGGATRLRGFVTDRFRDKNTMVATISYHYPIHEYVAGAFFVDVGNVGESYEELFGEPKRFRVGGGGGLLFRTRDANLFAMQLAYGESLQFVFTSDPLVTFDGRTDQL